MMSLLDRRKADVTTAYTDVRDALDTAGRSGGISAPPGVYAPQEDSRLLVDVLDRTGLAVDRRVVDLCTGSGVVAINAARQGAFYVSAFDICHRAVRCARANALSAGVDVDVRLGSWARAVEFGPYDTVVCNPPYVPHGGDDDTDRIPPHAGPPQAWNAGQNGRMVLDPLCAAAPALLADGGSLLVVHSEFSGVDQSLAALRTGGLNAEVIAEQWIPFGPVLTARAAFLERLGMLDPGRREEQLVVIRADKP